MSQKIDATNWQNYPMGPELKKWLNLSLLNTEASEELETSGPSSDEISESQKQKFSDFLLEHINVATLEDEKVLTDLMDELIAMDLPIPVIKLVDKFRGVVKNSNNFQYLLLEGVAAMRVEELGRAEECLRAAQEAMPQEPAPYVNLIQVLLYSDRDEEALQWVNAALTAEPNNLRIWELASELAYSLNQDATPPKTAKVFIYELAKNHNSWAGYSLSADLDEDANSQTKASLLDNLYAEGERSSEFLIEYTGALGAAGDFEKIPQIIWQAEKASSAKLPWQLQLHGCQAYLAMHKEEQFIETAGDILSKNSDLPTSLRSEIEAMIRDVQAEMQSGDNVHQDSQDSKGKEPHTIH